MADEEDVTAQLLRLAGARPEPHIERSARVRQAVHDAWRADRRRRIVRRSVGAIVLGAVAAAAVVTVRIDRASRVVPPRQEQRRRRSWRQPTEFLANPPWRPAGVRPRSL